MLDHTLKLEAVRRLEVITGTGRRRRFSKDDKAHIVEETLAPGAVVSEVARRHGLTPQQLFGWRRQARQPLAATGGEDARLSYRRSWMHRRRRAHRSRKLKRARRSGSRSGIIELAIDGVTVRVGRGAEAKTVAAVIRALKAGT